MAIVIKCHGEFYAKEGENGQLKMTKMFSEVLRAPSLNFFEQTAEKYKGTDDHGKLKIETKSFINIRGQLKKKLLPMILAQKYPGRFTRIRKVWVDEVVSDNGEVLDLPLNLMSITQISQRIKDRNIPIDVKSYLDVDELRTDVMEYEQDPETFQRTYARKLKKRQEEREFLELNNLLPQNAPVRLTKKGIASKVNEAETVESPF